MGAPLASSKNQATSTACAAGVPPAHHRDQLSVTESGPLRALVRSRLSTGPQRRAVTRLAERGAARTRARRCPCGMRRALAPGGRRAPPPRARRCDEARTTGGRISRLHHRRPLHLDPRRASLPPQRSSPIRNSREGCHVVSCPRASMLDADRAPLPPNIPRNRPMSTSHEDHRATVSEPTLPRGLHDLERETLKRTYVAPWSS